MSGADPRLLVGPPAGPVLVPEPDEVDGSYLITSIDSPWGAS